MSAIVTEPSDDQAMTLEDAAIAYVQAKQQLAAVEGTRSSPEFNNAFRAWSKSLIDLDRAAGRVAAERRNQGPAASRKGNP